MHFLKIRNWLTAMLMRHPRYAIGGAAAVTLLIIGMLFLFLGGRQPPVVASAMEEPCATQSGDEAGGRVGYLRTILLCAADSLRCKPDQTRVFRAEPTGSWNTEAMMIPDIPDGYVITGGDQLDPSAYRLRNLGFNSVKVTNYTNANDYCTQHYWYYMHADHISEESDDRARIKICVYYDKWRGSAPAAPCPYPADSPPQ